MSIIASPGCGNTESSCSKVSTTGVSYELTMYMTNDVPIGSKLYIQFPLLWNVANIKVPPDASTIGIDCVLYCNSGSIPTIDIAANTLIITSLFTDFQTAPGPLTIRLTNMDNPATTQRMYFTVTTYNEDGAVYKIDESTDKFFLDFQPGVITIAALYPNDLEILSSVGTWTFSMTPEHPVEPAYVMVITFPNTVTI